MIKLKMTKAVSGMVVSMGVCKIAWNIIEATTPASTSKIMKACIVVGGSVLVNMVSNSTITYMEHQIDGFAAGFKKGMTKTEVKLD